MFSLLLILDTDYQRRKHHTGKRTPENSLFLWIQIYSNINRLFLGAFLEQQRTEGERWIQTESQKTKNKKTKSKIQKSNLFLNIATIYRNMANTQRAGNCSFCFVFWELSLVIPYSFPYIQMAPKDQ